MRSRSSEIAGNDNDLFPRVIFMKISSVGADFEVLTTAGKTLDGFVGRTCENKWPDKKNLLAMAIDSDMKGGGVSPGSISRNYEGVGDRSVYFYFARLFRPALRGHGLSFQRDSGECSVYSQ